MTGGAEPHAQRAYERPGVRGTTLSRDATDLAQRRFYMGQVNVNPPSGPVVVNDGGGFGAGKIIGIILLILIVLVLIIYAGPQIFRSGTSPAPNPTAIPTPTQTFLDILFLARPRTNARSGT